MKLELIARGSVVASLVLGGCGGMAAGPDGGSGASAGDPGDGGDSGQGGGSGFGGVVSGGIGGFGGESGQTIYPAGGAGGSYCYYDGSTYMEGSSFTDASGCNSCSCMYGGQVVCNEMACQIACTYQGVTLNPGVSVPAGDGCNTCSCEIESSTYSYDTILTCTDMFCYGTCSYAGHVYANGEGFMATDGCNKCSCSNGNVACSVASCSCNAASEYWRSYVSNSPTYCKSMAIACPVGAGQFYNACGCGCEQSPSCPQAFNCVTGGGYDSGVASGGSTSSRMKAPVPVGGSVGAGGSTGVAELPIDPTSCATPTQRLECPLTPVWTYIY